MGQDCLMKAPLVADLLENETVLAAANDILGANSKEIKLKLLQAFQVEPGGKEQLLHREDGLFPWNHQPHHSTHQPRPAALGWEPSHPDRLIRSPTDQKDRLSTRTHLFRPPRRAAGRACRAARLGRGSGSCTRNRAGGGPGVGSWLGFAP